MGTLIMGVAFLSVLFTYSWADRTGLAKKYGLVCEYCKKSMTPSGQSSVEILRTTGNCPNCGKQIYSN
jgi:rRNA maturation endonuclease Nob1